MSKPSAFNRILDTLGNEASALTPKLLEALSDLSPAEAEALKNAWPSIKVQRRRDIVTALVDFMDEDYVVSFESLSAAIMDDPDAQVRAGAIRLLWDNGQPHMARTLLDRLQNDPDPEPRAEIAAVLGSYIYLGELEELQPPLKTRIEDSLLSAARTDSSPLVQRRAVEALGFSSRPEVPALIESAYKHADPHWIISALVAMGRSNDNRWEEHVLRAFTHENPSVRLAAIEAAGALSLESARIPLLASLDEDENTDIFRATIWSLSQIGGEDVRTYFFNLLDTIEEDEDLAEFIEEALENLTFTEGNPGLDFGLMNYDPEAEPDKPK